MMPRMICSMTSFSRQSHEDDSGSLVWELRTVNHRYLEISLRCPEPFRHQEMKIREVIQKYLSRGKVDATLKLIPGPSLSVDFLLNTALLEKLSQAAKVVRSYFPEAITNSTDILSWKGVLQVEETENETVNQNMLHLLECALTKLVGTRQREGEGLGRFIKENVEKIEAEAKEIEKQLPEIMTIKRERMQRCLSEIQDNLDEQRLEQEMVIWAQRADVAEELQRLHAHLQEVKQVLKKGGVIGRRLDFLMQELNREANTLSSKSFHANMTQSAVEMKVLIEQMREQVQNIE